MIVQV